jgi:hypothetical protein
VAPPPRLHVEAPLLELQVGGVDVDLADRRLQLGDELAAGPHEPLVHAHVLQAGPQILGRGHALLELAQDVARVAIGQLGHGAPHPRQRGPIEQDAHLSEKTTRGGS